MNLKKIKTLFVLMCFSSMMSLVVGCWESDTENAMEDVGEKIEETAEDAKDSAEDAAEKIKN